MSGYIIEPDDLEFFIDESRPIDITVVESHLDFLITEEILSWEIVEQTLLFEIGTDVIEVSIENYYAEGTGGSGYVFPLNASSLGIVGGKVYTPNTVPINTVLTECTTDNDTVTIFFLAEGAQNYSPVVKVEGVECTNLTQVAQDLRLFTGSVTIQVPATKTIMVQSDSGQSALVKVNRAASGPNVTTCAITGIPSGQTAVKAGDEVVVSGTLPISATEVQVLAFGAAIGEDWQPVTNGAFAINCTIGTGTGALGIQVQARNAFGTVGAVAQTSNTVLLDQVGPSFTDLGTVFPLGQLAFKGVEIGTQKTVVTGATSVLYSSPNGDFFIENPTLLEQDKEITCTHPGRYNDSTTNFRIIAVKASNGTSATFNKVVEVADLAPAISVTQPYSRLRSSPLGTDYIITATSNQNLLSSPSILASVGGDWQGVGFSGGPKVFQRTLRVNDSHAKGSGPWAIDGSVTNRAGLAAVIAGTQTLGGFTARDLVLEAFKNEIQVPVKVVDYSKLKISMWEFTGMPLARASVINTLPPVPGYFTIGATGVTPHTFKILDTNQTLASSKATMVYNYEEEV